MRRRTVLLAAALATLALGLIVATAVALTPPAGTPDLSKMAIQASDLAPGATVNIDKYSKAPRNFISVYERRYATAQTHSGSHLFGLDTEVLLAKTEHVATAFFSVERSFFGSASGRRVLAKAIAGEAVKKGVSFKSIRFGRFRSLGVGTQSLLQPISLRIKNTRGAAALIVLRVGPVIEDLAVVLTAPASTLAVARELAGDLVSHVTAVLGPTGATGATGTTGASGTTGATGATG